jgi:hypothetical protein
MDKLITLGELFGRIRLLGTEAAADTVDPTQPSQGRNTHIRLQGASYLGIRFTATVLQSG